jgi:ERCC4-type nuclease
MKIIIDSREADLYDKCNDFNVTTTSCIFRKSLDLGDILLTTDDNTDICIIERKSLKDLLASIKDGRYEEQSHRLANATNFHKHNIIYIIEGMMNQLHNVQEKKIVYSAMTSLNYYKGFSVVRTSCMQETAEFIVFFSDKIEKNTLKTIKPFYNVILAQESVQEHEQEPDTKEPANYSNFVKKVKKENITPSNIGQIILSQIPGISDVSAMAIIEKFKTIKNLLNEMEKDPDCLNDIMIGNKESGKTRKIGKNVIDGIKTYLG